MSSELQGLATVLTRAGGTAPTGRELAELLWLADHMEPGTPTDRSTGNAPAGRTPPAAPSGDSLRTAEPLPEPAHRAADASAPAGPGHDRVPMRLPSPRPAARDRAPSSMSPTAQTPLLAPAPPLLPHPLALQRALRPLRRTTPSSYASELDEHGTAHRIAAATLVERPPGAPPPLWLPLMRPRPERWLNLCVVFDTGPTMTMWRPLLKELCTVLAQTGAFRTITVLPLSGAGSVPARHLERARTTVLVVSDAMGPQWRAGPAGHRWYGTLRSWAQELPVALLQPLPERLWQHTALSAVAGEFASPGPGVPNAALSFTPYETGGPPPHALLLPCLEMSPDWLGHWASLVASPGSGPVPGAAARLHPSAHAVPHTADAVVPEEVPPDELVLRFRSIASPGAFRLAAHLAVGQASLPVMRLVQAATEERPRPQHLAEVVLSGMLKAEPGPPSGAYTFRPGVREVLLGTLPRSSLLSTAQLLGRVSAQIEARAGAVPGEFRALVAADDGTVSDALGSPFALVSPESVRLLRGPVGPPAAPSGAQADGVAESSGTRRDTRARKRPDPQHAVGYLFQAGRYELERFIGSGRSGEVWQAMDHSLLRVVALKFFRYEPGVAEFIRISSTSGFLSRVQELAQISRPNLVGLYDAFETRDGCGVVMELVNGPALDRLAKQHPDGIEPGRLVAFGKALLNGLRSLHRAGLVHGSVKLSNIVLTKHDSPLLVESGLRWPYGAAARSSPPSEPLDDLRGLGRVLYELATGSPPDEGARGRLRIGTVKFPVLEQQIMDLIGGDADACERAAAEFSRLDSADFVWRYRVLAEPLATIGPRRRTRPEASERDLVLACLLLARGRPVPFSELRRAVGHDEASTGHEYTMHLRALGHDIQSSNSSCWLEIDRSELDLVVAESLVQRAEVAYAAGDFEETVEMYDEALALFGETPLGGLRGPWAAGERRRLSEWRQDLANARRVARAAASASYSTPVIVYLFVDGSEADEQQASRAVRQLVGAQLRVPTDRTSADLGQLFHMTGVGTAGLVTWATETFPDSLAAILPVSGAPVLVKLLLFATGSPREARQLRETLPTAAPAEEAGVVTVSVGISRDQYRQLAPGQRRGFRPFGADPAREGRSRAAGWYRTITLATREPLGAQVPIAVPDAEATPPAAARSPWWRRLFPEGRGTDRD